MPTIDDTSRSLIKGAFKKKGGKIWSAAVAKLYKCQAAGRGPGTWNQATKAGALLFLRDAEQDENMFLRLVDIDNGGRSGGDPAVLWEHEMWIGFEWVRSDQPYFYTFESDDCVYGVMFSDVHEASDFAKNVNKRIKKIGRGTTLTDSDSASIRSGRSAASSNNNTASSGKSFFRSIFNPASRADDQPSPKPSQQQHQQRSPGRSPLMSGQIRESDIGDPIGFKHLGHIGFNPDTGTFDMKNIPPQWQKFLDGAGVTKADLQNKETATFIAGFLDRAVKEQGEGRKAPPPPPPKAHKAPAPAPPARNSQPRYVGPVAPKKPVVEQSRPAPIREQRPTERPAVEQRPTTRASVAVSMPAAPPYEDYLAFIDETRQAAAARQEEQAAAPKAVPPRPAMPDLNSQLMAGIKGAGLGSLKHVEKPDPASLPPMSPGLDVPGDAMAGLLAKALQSRQKAMAHSESEDDNDDWA